MNGRERIEAAMKRQTPDRVPVWCQLGVIHTATNGLGGRTPRTTEELIEAECNLTKRYNFDGVLPFLPGAHKGSGLGGFYEGVLKGDAPSTNSANIFEEADPESWPKSEMAYDPDKDFYAARLAREVLGDGIHIGGWMGEGFSKTMQWFPSLDEALVGMLTDPARFKAMIEYFDQDAPNFGRGQARYGHVESMHISSPYAGSSFISRDMYEEFVLPSLTKAAAAMHEEGIFCYVHTCGFIGDRIDLLARSGVDGIECMDPAPLGDVDLAEAKQRFGDKVFLKGNLDSVNVLLYGSDEDVERAVRECLEKGMPGGGYILSTACSVAPKVKPERMERLAELAEKYGRYS